LILAAGIAAGADRGDWQNLAQLEAGKKIEVFTGRGKAKGEFVRFDPDALTIREKNGARAVPRPKSRGYRHRNDREASGSAWPQARPPAPSPEGC
jgi:hypothetical protein